MVLRKNMKDTLEIYDNIMEVNAQFFSSYQLLFSSSHLNRLYVNSIEYIRMVMIVQAFKKCTHPT